MKKLSIIMPAYNEEKRIEKTLEEYGKFFTNLKRKKIIESEILIVLNACEDGTLNIVKKYSKKYNIIKYFELERAGKGLAIVEGFKCAIKKGFDLIGFVDADMATSPEEFYDLVKNIGNYGGIIASRYAKGAIVKPKQTIQRIIVSRIFNIMVKSILFLPYTDTQCGAKLFKIAVLKEAIPKLKMSKWAFDIDLIYSVRKKNFRIKEIATKWSDKKYSKINFMKAGPMMMFAIIRLRILNSWFKSFIKIYDKIIIKIVWKIFK